MIYSNFTGRVAKKAKLIDGVNGQFLSMDLAVNNYSKGEEVTQWVRVQSSDPAHLKLAEYFTKGRILTIQGNCNSCHIRSYLKVALASYFDYSFVYHAQFLLFVHHRYRLFSLQYLSILLLRLSINSNSLSMK